MKNYPKLGVTITFYLKHCLFRARRFKMELFETSPLDPEDFGFLDPNFDPQKYADPRIRIQGGNYQPKTKKIQ